ncbi:Transcription factor bHLH112, partial [Linum grandiflorum]
LNTYCSFPSFHSPKKQSSNFTTNRKNHQPSLKTMAEEFETGICGGGSWWNNLLINPSRTTLIGGGGGGGGGDVSSICSPVDFGSWLAAAAASSSPDAVVLSNNSSLNSDCSDSGGSTTTATAGVMMDSSALQIMGFGGVGVSSSSPSEEDWNQRQQLNSMLEDEMNSCGRPLSNLSGLTNDFSNPIHGYPVQGLFESDSHQNSIFLNNFPSPSPSSTYGTGNSLLLNGLSPSWAKFQNPNHQNDNRFPNHLPFWSNQTSTQADNIRTGYLPVQNRFALPAFDEKPTANTCPISSTKQSKNEEATNTSNKGSKSKTKKEASTESSFKRPRIETPSSLPTFKVRKEKLGDRITALQQLVSPFGKTDTASVLHEAIEYIKFLHDQVGVLSTPYMKNGNPIQHHQQGCDKLDQNEQDLRSRGLCLVPISSTFPVAHETTADFWTPTFGGSFR